MPRITPLLPENMTARQKQVHDEIASGPRGGVRGPLAVWLNRPDLADHAQALGRYCRYDTLLSPRLSELAILTTARLWRSEFEWAAHKPLGLAAGLTPDVIEAIRTNHQPAFNLKDEAVVYSFAQCLHTERQIDNDLYARAISVLGAGAVVDLTGILGYYTLISMTINVFAVQPLDGATPAFTEEK